MGIIDLIFPKLCVACRREGEYICRKCQVKLLVPDQVCPACCKSSLDGWVHPNCRTRYGMERLIVGLSYPGIVQKCLKKVKYKSAQEIISFLYNLSSFGELGEFSVTSVPMWISKQRMRGFNQAEVLAKLIARDHKIPIIVSLARTRATQPQYGLNKQQRISNIEGAFRVVSQVANLKIILVDDVWTTGATMRECASILKRAGAKEVWGVALAK